MFRTVKFFRYSGANRVKNRVKNKPTQDEWVMSDLVARTGFEPVSPP